MLVPASSRPRESNVVHVALMCRIGRVSLKPLEGFDDYKDGDGN